jgi:hypothetical protein
MLTVETIGRIRREHLLKGKTIRRIARDLKVSRNRVRKVLRSGETSFAYEREVQPRPKLGRWTAQLDDLLASNAAKPSRERLTLIRIFEDLRERGYPGGYDAVRRYARRWSKAHGQSMAGAYVPLSFAAGEAYHFDWSHEFVVLNARRRRWCSMPMNGRSRCSRARAGAKSIPVPPALVGEGTGLDCNVRSRDDDDASECGAKKAGSLWTRPYDCCRLLTTRHPVSDRRVSDSSAPERS